MELRHLRYFVTLAETLNFTRAASSMYISQSALSQQVADLETELGVQLFHRTKRSVQLTDAGQALLIESRKLLRQMEQLAPIVRNSATYENQQRSVLIGLDIRAIRSSCLRKALTDEVFHMHGSLPGFQANFLTYEHDALVQALENNAVDVGFFLHQKPIVKENSSLSCCFLHEEEMVLAVRAEQELEDTPEMLLKILRYRGIILLENETRGMNQAMGILDELKVEPSVHFVSNRDNMILSLESGERATILPVSVLSELQNQQLQILHFRVPGAALHYVAAWQSYNNNPLIPKLVEAAAHSFSVSALEES